MRKNLYVSSIVIRRKTSKYVTEVKMRNHDRVQEGWSRKRTSGIFEILANFPIFSSLEFEKKIFHSTRDIFEFSRTSNMQDARRQKIIDDFPRLFALRFFAESFPVALPEQSFTTFVQLDLFVPSEMETHNLPILCSVDFIMASCLLLRARA